MKRQDNRSESKEARQKKYWKRTVFLLILLAFLLPAVAKNLYHTDSKLKKELKSLNRNLNGCALNIHEALMKLDRIEDIGTVPNMKKALKAVESAKVTKTEGKRALEPFLSFVISNKKELHEEGLEVYILLTGIFGKTFVSLQQAIDEYLDCYKRLLEHSLNNHESIALGKPSEIQKYDELYSNLKEAYDNRWKTYSEHRKFILKYSEMHPEIAGYINKAEQMLERKTQEALANK